MSSLIRWNPIRDAVSMSDMMDRLFNDAFLDRRGNGFPVSPDMDVIENDDNIVVKAELPGFKSENVDVRVEGNLLTIRGEYHEESEKKEGQYHLKERRQSSFSRSIPLPVGVNADKAKAEFENGVLTLTLPKHEDAKPRRITIMAKNGK
jgi:HSP20 family protein